MNTIPKVTVLMPVYNGEKYLVDAINSILNQSFENFEFLIINDASTDQSVQIIQQFTDSRIKLIHNQQNLKLVKTLNKGLDLANGEYIARMDCDDISLPNRLYEQVKFMDANKTIGVSGTWAKTIGDSPTQFWRQPTIPDIVKCKLFFECCIIHPSVIFRKSLIDKYELRYSSKFGDFIADWDMWRRCSMYFDIANIPYILLHYRITQNSMSHSSLLEQANYKNEVSLESFNLLGITPSINELKLLNNVISMTFIADRNYISQVACLLEKINDANIEIACYPISSFSQHIAYRLFAICNAAASLGFFSWQIFYESPLSKIGNIDNNKKVKFFLKCLLKKGIEIQNKA